MKCNAHSGKKCKKNRNSREIPQFDKKKITTKQFTDNRFINLHSMGDNQYN